MIKFKLLLALCLVSNALLASTESREISYRLDHYDYQDVKEIAQLCHVAYGVEESPYTASLESAGWDIQELRNIDDYQYGVAANNGPLKVVSFKGTDDITTLLSDVDAVQASTETRFAMHPKSVVHRGIYDYYISVDPVEHFSHLDEDQFLVLSGHSLGGAVTNLAALDLVTIQNKAPHNFPDGFFSLFTLGAPPVLGPELCQVLCNNFARGTHGRVYFDNDPIATITRGKSGEPLNLLEEVDVNSVFKHTGYQIPFSGTGLLSHSVTTYIDHLASVKPSSIFPIWRTWEERGEAKPIVYRNMGKVFFNATGGSPGYFLPNYNSLSFPEDIQRAFGKYLSSSGWAMARNTKTYHRSWHPKRFADLAFYKIWKSEHLGAKEFLESIFLLERKFDFTSSDYYQNTFFHLERLMKKHNLTYSDIEEMCAEVDTSEIDNHDFRFGFKEFDPKLRVYFFMKKYLENRKEF